MLGTVFIKIMVAIFVLNIGVNSADDINFSHENRKQTNSIISTNNIHIKTTSEWQVERNGQNHYGIDKMLSMKTNTCLKLNNVTSNNELNSTEKNVYNKSNHRHHVKLLNRNPNKDSFPFIRLQTNLQTSTPSYIEFHYFDNIESLNTDRTNIQNSVNNYKIAFFRPPLFLVRLNDAVCNTPSENFMISSNIVRSNTIKFIRHNNVFTKSIQSLQDESTKYRQDALFINSPKVNNETIIRAYKRSTDIYKKENRYILPRGINNTRNKSPSVSIEKYSRKFESTTAYDRIKFFEIYDSDTYPPRSLPLKEKNDEFQSNFNRSKANINLNKDDSNFYTSKRRYNLMRYERNYPTPNDTKSEYSKYITKSTSSIKMNNPNKILTATCFPYLSQSASWSEFPFVAVYTYEPAQVHCDCASISSHWLVSSATCLYLHHEDFRTEGISAFVSYCSNNWRQPGRIAYVRRSLLHPRFKPSDKTRRKLFNIGVIQVANSMANTCNGWQPISLMSHQFVAGPDGTLATAVGWGLDRYDTRYSTSELPLHPLMMYQSLVFSDSCPGNLGYSKAKLFNEESVKNVYCLSLPPYIKEENDTVHGGLLLVEGKLIALYFQEERRPWGLQSAQYTSIWRLIPWLLDVAQETDELDPLDAEI